MKCGAIKYGTLKSAWIAVARLTRPTTWPGRGLEQLFLTASLEFGSLEFGKRVICKRERTSRFTESIGRTE